MTSTETTATSTPLADLGLLILRIGVGAAMIQAGLIKLFDFSTTVGFMDAGGWSLPTFAALMVSVAETAGGIGLILGLLTPLAACAVVGAMICAWAVNVSEGAFWSRTVQRAVSAVHRRDDAAVHRRRRLFGWTPALFGRQRWSPRIAVGLLVLAFVVAILTWILLNGTNPIHFSSPE